MDKRVTTQLNPSGHCESSYLPWPELIHTRPFRTDLNALTTATNPRLRTLAIMVYEWGHIENTDSKVAWLRGLSGCLSGKTIPMNG